MFRAPLAAFAVVFCASVAFAQQSDLNKLVVTVQDQSSAVIPGAGVRVTEEGTNRIFDAVADQIGQAELHLPKGNFTVRVQARGFATWRREGFDPALQVQLHVTMVLPRGDIVICGPCIGPPPYVAPEDSVRDSDPAMAVEIQLIPLQTLNLRSRRLRLKTHAG